jgi:UDP-N-acetylmuramoyl-L-alanyl-D-glutamate--2,6-diaminopimelate ligase
MKSLSSLLKFVPHEVFGSKNRKISGIAYHSQNVKSNYMFVAINGLATSGKKFISEALHKGANVITCDDINLTKQLFQAYPNVTFILTPNTRKFLATAANWFYNFPSQNLKIIGITGTDGKTTTSYLIKSILEAGGKRTGLIGTIKYFDGQKYFPASHTTPESLDLVRFLRRLRTKKIPYCVCEVSSHALALDRVYGINFNIGIFTNITQDHLDFHKTMEAYQKAKLKLFQMLNEEAYAIINFDDEFSNEIYKNTRAQVIGYGINTLPRKVYRNIKIFLTADIISKNQNGTAAKIKMLDNLAHKNIITADVFLPMLGDHNVLNMLAAFATGYILKIPVSKIIKGIAQCPPVKGRLQKIACDAHFDVYIDYAHTPKGLQTSINTLREITEGKIIVVFGCGGNRDPMKRPLMGIIATKLADYVIITSDNPRNENPHKIVRDITKRIKTKKNYEIIIDRATAIERAIRLAQSKDAILIAGKGHENYQIIGDQKIPFSDEKIALKIIKTIH